jgi:hypothetical protein
LDTFPYNRANKIDREALRCYSLPARDRNKGAAPPVAGAARLTDARLTVFSSLGPDCYRMQYDRAVRAEVAPLEPLGSYPAAGTKRGVWSLLGARRRPYPALMFSGAAAMFSGATATSLDT